MFYERFSKLCKENNIRKTVLLTKLGLCDTNVTNWKNGADPSGNIIKKIANYFNVSIDYLLGNEYLPNASNDTCHDEIECALLHEIKGIDEETKKAILIYARYKKQPGLQSIL